MGWFSRYKRRRRRESRAQAVAVARAADLARISAAQTKDTEAHDNEEAHIISSPAGTEYTQNSKGVWCKNHSVVGGGKVLQVVFEYDHGARNSTIYGWQTIPLWIGITPKSATSTLYVEWKIHIYNDTNSTWSWESINTRLLRNDGVIWTDKTYHAIGGIRGYDMMSGIWTHADPSGSTAHREYKIQVDGANDSRYIHINHYGQGHMKVTEVEA